MGTVLVTGGAGYVGSHACKTLARAGYTPVTYDSLVHGHDWAVKWGPLEIGDMLDSARLEEVITRYRPEVVMHFAAFANVAESAVVMTTMARIPATIVERRLRTAYGRPWHGNRRDPLGETIYIITREALENLPRKHRSRTMHRMTEPGE